MDYYSKLAITFLFFIIFFVCSSSQCFRSQCSLSESYVRSPFWITGLQPASCGYQGFSLSCNRANRTILNLPHSGEFIVGNIYYSFEKIALSDPNMCLAQKLLALNLSGTPFKIGASYQNFTFFNCSKIEKDSVYNSYVIPCLSGSNYSVIATTSYVYIPTCMAIKQVKFPNLGFYYRTYTLEDELFLSWDTPYCPGCQGRCDYKNASTLETTCIYIPLKVPNKAAIVAPIMGVIIAMVVCVCGIPWCLSRASGEIRTDEVVVGNTSSSTVIVTATSGLSTNTYIVTIGESCRLPNPEADTCPICMSKYEPKDSIKSIFECSHYFHVDCINEWLPRNATCPLCRTSPLQ